MDTTDPMQFLGMPVTVVIDRPLGSTHPRHDWKYPVNYGHVAGTRSADGAELDAYVLAVDLPCASFDGTCIAVILRSDDDDPKLVVVPRGVTLSDEDIRARVHFQERFFQSRIVR